MAGRGHRDRQPAPAHRLHHRIKTLTDTTVHVDPDGTTVWALPSGRSYRVPPHQVIDHPNLDPPALRHAMGDLRDAIRQIRQDRQSHPDRGQADPDPPAATGTWPIPTRRSISSQPISSTSHPSDSVLIGCLRTSLCAVAAHHAHCRSSIEMGGVLVEGVGVERR